MTQAMNTEFGALLLRRGKELELAFFQVGKSHEIDLAPTRHLAEEEYLLGTCIKPETIILGDNKSIYEYQAGDRVIGMSGLNDVKQTFQRDYSGEMVDIKAGGILPFSVT